MSKRTRRLYSFIYRVWVWDHPGSGPSLHVWTVQFPSFPRIIALVACLPLTPLLWYKIQSINLLQNFLSHLWPPWLQEWNPSTLVCQILPPSWTYRLLAITPVQLPSCTLSDFINQVTCVSSNSIYFLFFQDIACSFLSRTSFPVCTCYSYFL